MDKQTSLFLAKQTACTTEELTLPQASLRFAPEFLSPEEAKALQVILRKTVEWEQSTLYLYGKWVKIPRLSAWYGDPGCDYQYSNTRFTPLPWTDELLMLKQRVETLTHTTFNSVLLNCYRNGQDSMDWHSDDEPELGQNPVIASLSVGETRPFHLRHKTNKLLPVTKLPLESGSLLIMQGSTQQYWQHKIPKTRKPCTERINLTFRRVFS